MNLVRRESALRLDNCSLGREEVEATDRQAPREASLLLIVMRDKHRPRDLVSRILYILYLRVVLPSPQPSFASLTQLLI